MGAGRGGSPARRVGFTLRPQPVTSNRFLEILYNNCERGRTGASRPATPGCWCASPTTRACGCATGVTERTGYGIVTGLAEAGYVVHAEGRPPQPLPDPGPPAAPGRVRYQATVAAMGASTPEDGLALGDVQHERLIELVVGLGQLPQHRLTRPRPRTASLGSDRIPAGCPTSAATRPSSARVVPVGGPGRCRTRPMARAPVPRVARPAALSGT